MSSTPASRKMSGSGKISSRSAPTSAAPAGSINAVAARAGVSIATVSRVINGVANKASPATIARVREAIAALDYRPSSAGQALRQKKSRLVAVLAANLANPAMAAIAASAEIALRDAGLVMVLCDTHDRPDLQDEYLRAMQAQQARAIVLLGAVTSQRLAEIQSGTTPLVFVNRRNPLGDSGAFVGIDNLRAGKDAAQWALANASGAIALVHAPLASSATRERVEGIRQHLAAAGHPLKEADVLSPPARDHLEIGYEAAQSLIVGNRQPALVICTSDLIAFGVARAWREAGPSRPMPRLIGFDDSPLNAWLAPTLTSIRIPYPAFGRAIMAAISEPQALGAQILPHRIIERG